MLRILLRCLAGELYTCKSILPNIQHTLKFLFHTSCISLKADMSSSVISDFPK